jgi:hypothetical protein
VVSSLVVLVWMWVTDRRGQTKPAVKEWRPYAKFHQAKNWLFGLIAFVAAWRLCESVGGAAYDWVNAALRW